MASAVETGSLFNRWRRAVDFAVSMQSADNGLLDRLKMAAGEVSLHSAFGAWCVAVSTAIDSWDPLADPARVPDGAALSSLLKAAGGEVQMGSALGRWAQGVCATLSATRV